jgi:hypothetical protein
MSSEKIPSVEAVTSETAFVRSTAKEYRGWQEEGKT